MTQIALVPKEFIPEVWGTVARFVERATKYTNGRYATSDVLALLEEYNYPLWIAIDDERNIKGAVITRFVDYPRKRYLSLEFCGGDDGPAWKDAMLDTLRKWAKDNDCDGIEAAGRAGWSRVFRNDGYDVYSHNFELSLEG